MRALWRHHQVIQARGTVVSCQVIQSGYPGAHAGCVISFASVTQLYEPLEHETVFVIHVFKTHNKLQKQSQTKKLQCYYKSRQNVIAQS